MTDKPEFKREHRYIVVKRSHLERGQETRLMAFLDGVLRVEPVECVVVEHDWPEYEAVWQMLEARVNGAEEVHTDCRSEEGVTVGLVDTVINSARLLKHRPATPAVEQALQDLRADEDVAALLADPVPPAGPWKLVPVEPTDAMIQAAINTPCDLTGDDSVDQPQDYRNMYAAMLDIAPVIPAGGEPGSITLTPEHAERLINRLSKAQMFKEVTELRAVMAQPVRPLAGLPERHDFPHRSEFETANQYTSALDTAKTWNAAWDEWAPHVTRLQAEVERLQSEADSHYERRMVTQDELTKARERIGRWVGMLDTPATRQEMLEGMRAYLSNQSAPADKPTRAERVEQLNQEIATLLAQDDHE